jgi:16S rRNA (cytosine967-C5)-methyltransferase
VAPPEDARDLAFTRLARHAGKFPDLEPLGFDDAGLDAREAGLAHAIEDAVLRRWLTLSHLIEFASGRAVPTLEPRVQGVLLGGAAQLLLLDRVPDHAAIDTAVAWAKSRVRAGAGPIVNAVLRRVAELRGDADRAPRERWTGRRDEIPLADGTARGLEAPALPERRGELLAAACSVPLGALHAWKDAFGPTEAERLAVHTLVHAPVVLNVEHASLAARATLARLSVAHEAPGSAVFTGSRGELASLATPGSDGAGVWVQDAAASGAVRSVCERTPRVVIDVCAGRGTKTRQLLATFPQAEVIATEVSADRLGDLRRLAESQPRLGVMPASGLMPDMAGRADLVVLDVPCSNSGVLARRPEARYRLGPSQARRLADVQRQLVADAIPLLAPGGVILYSTCSIEGTENGAIAAWASQWHRFTRASERSVLPRGLPGEAATAYADGAYSVVLRP